MAHRILAQIALTGSRVIGRAFAEAYRQAQASSKYQQAAASGRIATSSARLHAGLTMQEACQILNVKPPKADPKEMVKEVEVEKYMEEVMGRFKKLFDLNDPKKGGSFYLQSKILRARERIESEVREKAEKLVRDQELAEGWKPKIYKK